MILRIILGIMAVLFVFFIAQIVVPMWKLMARTKDIFVIFEGIFDVFPEERKKLFAPDQLGVIGCGKVRLIYYSFEEAVAQFEGYIDELLRYYEQYDKLVRYSLDLQSCKEKLLEIREKIKYLKK